MLAEHEPRQTAQNDALCLEADGKRMSYSRKDWYTNKDIADMVGRSLPVVGPQLHKIRAKDKSIEITTLGNLNRKGNFPFIGKPQTIVYSEENFIKAVIAVASTKTKRPFHTTRPESNMHKSPKSKEKNPKKPRKDSSFNPFTLITESPPKPPTHLKEMLNIKFPEQILGINSVIKALSHLTNGTLKDISHDIQKFLEKVATEHVLLPRFENDPKDEDGEEERILIKIFYTDSTNHLNRFFRVSLDSMLYDLWDVIDINERTKEEKKIIEICNQLKEKGYDKERAAQELLDHFSIPQPNKPTQD